MNIPINHNETDKFIMDKLCIFELSEFHNEQYFTCVDNEIGAEFDELYEFYVSFIFPLNYSSK